MKRTFNSFATNFSYRLINLLIKIFHTSSMQVLITKCVLLFSILAVTLFLFTSAFFSHMMNKQVSNNIQDTLKLYNEKIGQDFSNALDFLSNTCLKNVDVSLLNTAQLDSSLYHYTVRIQKLMSTISFPNIGGIFIYSQSSGVFIPQANISLNENQSNQKCAQTIKHMLDEHNTSDTLDELSLNEWHYFTVDGEAYLLHIIKERNTYAGAWTNLSLPHPATTILKK